MTDQRNAAAKRNGGGNFTPGCGIGAFAASAWVAGGDDAPPPTTTAPQPLLRLRVIFPEGFSVAEMGERVAAVREIAIAKRRVTPRLTKDGYLRAVNRAS